MFEGVIHEYLSPEKLNAYGSKTVGSKSFEVLIDPLTNLREVLERANTVDKFITGDKRQKAQEQVSELQTYLIEILSFDAAVVQNAGQRYDQLISVVVAKSDLLTDIILPALGMRSGEDIKKLREAQIEAERILEKLKKTEKIVGSQTSAAASDHASSFFDVQAGNSAKTIKKYALALGALIVATIAFSLLWDPKIPSAGETNAQTFARALPALNTLAIAWFAIRLVARNLRNHQHLKILNETKSMILKSGEQFSVSAQGAPVADNIMQIVVASTFTIGDTGYLPSEPDTSNFGNSGLMGLWKGVSGKS